MNQVISIFGTHENVKPLFENNTPILYAKNTPIF